MIVKRFFDILMSLIGIILFLPICVIIGLVIKLTSHGPIIFRQLRVGRYGHVFYIHKFRTMVVNSEKNGLQITADKDKRITPIGKLLRKYKLDELPQLYDVLVGHMSFVGPRPEVPEFVNMYPENIKQIVLSVRPGITEVASIIMVDEGKLLSSSDDPKWLYTKKILPQKLDYAVQYVKNRTNLGDFKIILMTIKKIITR